MSIGGAAAGIDLGSSAVADRFVETIVPILKKYNFDGIDIDIETGLVGSGNISFEVLDTEPSRRSGAS